MIFHNAHTKYWFKTSFLLVSILLCQFVRAQTLSTTGTFLNNNGSGNVTFNLQNSNSYPIIISEIRGVIGTTGTSVVSMYYNPTPISGAPAAITTANGWNLVATSSISATGNTTTTTTQTFLSGLSFIIPANTTYGILIFGTSQRYSSIAAGTTTISQSGVNLITGTSIGYGGNTVPTAPTITPRGWIGQIVFAPAIACSGTPTPGNAVASLGYACAGQNIGLSLVNDSIRTGLTYQWLRSTTSVAGPYSIIPNDTNRSTIDTQSVSTWYRCLVTCSGTSSDTSTAVFVKTTTIPLSGTYTVNSGLPASSTNYNSLSYLASELSCVGISGPVTINVAAGSGPYLEQLSFGNIPGTSATNTVTLNGNGNTISTPLSPMISFLGTKHFILDSFNIIAIGTTLSGFGIYMGNQAQNIIIRKNKVDVGITATATSNAGIVISGSATAPTTVGNNAQNIQILNNEIIGGYYSITAIGNASYLNNSGHIIQNNTVRDFYIYGVYLNNADSCLILNNDIHRSGRATITTFYGIYLGTAKNIKVRNNRIRDAGSGAYTAYPIYVTVSANTVGFETEFINNVIYNINTTGTVYGIYFLGARTNIKVYHNTVALVNNGTGAVRCFSANAAPDGHDLRNNIFSISGSGTGIKHVIYVTTVSASFVSNYNVLYMGATAGTNSVGFWAINNTTLADWTAASGGDANSINANPVYANLPGGNFTPLSINIDDKGTPLTSVSTDIFGNLRSTTTPDVGSVEFLPVAGDIGISKVELLKSSVCYSANDTIKVTLQNVIGAPIDFSIDPITIVWNQLGPFIKTDSIIVNSGILGVGSSSVFFASNVNMSTPGFYSARAFIRSSTINTIASNDTLQMTVPFEVKAILSVLPKTRTVTSSTDTVTIEAFSPLFPGGNLFFSEIAHYKVATGAPVGGWPAYLIADDYVELTGIPNSSIAGFTMEEWTGTTLQHSVTFPSGTVFSPSGTMVLATGQLGASAPSPTNFYYHTGNTVTHSSTGDNRGYLIKNSSGIIIDATVYGVYTFPAASGVTAAIWIGSTPAVSSSGNRLNAPDNNTSTCWVNSGVTPQNPNALNGGVSLPVLGSMAGFNWSYLGSPIDTNAKIKVGPYTVPGIYRYVATYTTVCGTFRDTVTVTATSTVPVTLTTFEGEKQNEDVLLSWKTVSEINNDFFEVQVSTDRNEYEKIGMVKGVGNSNNVNSYTFKHENAFSIHPNSESLFYRLAQHDFDGKINYSTTIRIANTLENNEYFKVIPNPNQGQFTLMVSEQLQNNVGSLQLVNSLGEIVWTLNKQFNSGLLNIDLDLPNGIYFMQAQVNNKLVHTKILIAK